MPVWSIFLLQINYVDCIILFDVAVFVVECIVSIKYLVNLNSSSSPVDGGMKLNLKNEWQILFIN